MKDQLKEKKIIADRFKTIRESTGLDQIKFADMIGIPRQTVSKIETGRQEISPRVLRESFKRMGVSPEYLLGLRDDKSQDFNKLKTEIEELKRENLDLKERLEETKESLRMAKELLDFFRNQK